MAREFAVEPARADEIKINPHRLKQLQALIADGREHVFYTWGEWLDIRAAVLKLDHHECQRCRTVYHRYRRATMVHHIQHLKDRPDLALNVWYKGQRQLVSLCYGCHEEEHPERFAESNRKRRAALLTPERWD